MKTVILAGVVAKGLSVLTEGLPTGALHFAIQPLSVYAIKQVETFNTNIFVQSAKACNDFIDRILPFLGWQTRLNELDNLEECQSEEVLWLRDDVLYNLDFSELLTNLRQASSPYVAVFANQVPVMFYKKTKVVAKERDFPEFEQSMSTAAYCREIINAMEWQHIDLLKNQAEIIDSPRQFYQVVMTLLRGEYQHVELDPHQKGKKLMLGWHTGINQSSLMQNYAYLGDCAYVHKDSQLKGDVILCKGCYIDKLTNIENAIVLPNIYIGPHLNIKNAIVTATAIIRIDTNVIIPIEDTKFVKKIAA